MAGVAPVRLLGPIRALDGRTSHSLSSVRRTSKTSLLLFLHRNRFPSLHSQSPNWRLGQICSASLKEVNEEESSTQRDTWKKQAPKGKGTFKYPVRGQSSEPQFPWRAVEEDEPSNGRRSYSGGSSVQDKRSDPSTRINKNGPGSGAAAQRRHLNSRNNQGPSSTRRGDEAKKSSDPARSTTSRYSQYDTGRNMHRAPWEQGLGRPANENSRDTPPMKRVSERGEADGVEGSDSRSGEGNHYQGGGQKSAMARIVEKLRAIGNDASASQMDFNENRPATETSVFLPRPGQSGVDRRWTTADHPVPKRASDDQGQLTLSERFPWEKDGDEEEDEKIERKKKVKPPSMAELTIPEPELKRLRTLGLQMHGRLKVGRLGVTPGIVEAIHDRWRSCEIAKVRCDAPLSMNMKKAHEDLERLTGGLVVWRSGSAAMIYRGKDYVHPFVREREEREERERRRLLSLDQDKDDAEEQVTDALEAGNKEEEGLSLEKDLDSTEDQLADRSSLDDSEKENPEKEKLEADLIMMEEILDGLGPRYADWTGRRPVPVDADLLLSPDFEFKRPFRLLPYGVKPKLNNFELTELRRLARPVPPHFVLGRNRGLGGLAAAIVKLWEKSEIVKIGVKRGVQNTSNERMAEELKRLTGGTLLARDKEYIVFSRGKDFLPPSVQVVLEERDRMAKSLQEEEERLRIGGRKRALEVVEPSKAGTLEEAMETRASWEAWQNSDEARRERIAARKAKRAQATDRIRSKMRLALQKKERAEAELAKINAKMHPADAPLDKEHLSDGERYMYKKLGLKMKAFLLLGRRGVFGGTVENMHLHWKYRELVKILVKAPLPEAQRTARMLEIESGGILVDIVTTSKGQAIIVYRGKNYQRPPELRPRHLLTKRQALKRSLEMQRMQSLEKHLATLEKEIETMQAGLTKIEDEDELEGEEGSEGNLEEMDDDGLEYDDEYSVYKTGKPKPGSYFQAEPLTRKQRHFLRQQIPLMVGKTANFNIGKSTIYEDLAKSICRYFEKHPFVKIGVKGRPPGTSVASVVEQIEESTGAVMLSTEPSKLIFYRGWPPGEERPDLAALKKENEEKDEHSSDRTDDVKGFEAVSDDETDATDDDFGIDAWNEEDWEEADEDDEDESGEDKIVEFEEEEREQGHWVSFSGEESDYTDTDLDELVTALSQDDAVEQNVNDKSDNTD